MPPKSKISKEDIVSAGVDLVRRSGEKGLNARNLAAALGCSTQPIFTNFPSMEELRKSVICKASELYYACLERECAAANYPPGYPGKYVVLARRHADKWYIAGINAQKEPLKLKLNLPMCTKGDKVMLYQDDKKLNPHAEEITLKKNDEVSITMQAEGGFLLVK